MSTPPLNYRRPALAMAYCAALTGSGIEDARSGLFLAAPRRTGKSTFLRQDLIPALTHLGWLPVYVDLWAKKDSDPGHLIATAVKSALTQFDGVITKLAKASGLEKVNVFGALVLNFQSAGLPPNVTLPDALEALQLAAGRPVVVVIDEAQHALSTPEGMAAMFALKAARDHLNQGFDAQQKLFLVFTGSNQDKLSRLVLKRDQPFYGCRVSKFPLLDRGYSDDYTRFINTKLASDNQFDIGDMWAAFDLVGRRPEMLKAIIADLALEGGTESLHEKLNTGAQAFRSNIWGEMDSDFNALSKIQQAVLIRLIKTGTAFEPFKEASLAAYSADAGRRVSSSDAQAALAALREKNLVWQAAYGDYALEDESMATWYNSQATPPNTLELP